MTVGDKKKVAAVPKDDRKLALVIVDVQKKFLTGDKDTTMETIRENTPQMLNVISRFREAGRPVIWILYEGETCVQGITDDSDILLDGFKIEEGDSVVRKYHMNSFLNTNLSDVIRSKGCDGALLMGMYAQHCVMSTYWGAFDKDISPYMMEGCLISTDRKYCDLAIELCKHYTMEELESNLRVNSKKAA